MTPMTPNSTPAERLGFRQGQRGRTPSGLPVVFGEFGPKQPTRYRTLMYQHRIDHWRILDCTEPTWTAGVGPLYRTRAELLADLDRFAEARGYD